MNENEELRLYFLNVGNADTICGFSNENISFLIDLVDPEKISNLISPLTNKNLTFILITHSDYDHIRGLYDWIENFGYRANTLYINCDRSPVSKKSKEYIKILRRLLDWEQTYGIKILPAHAVHTVMASVLKITIIHPSYAFLGSMQSLGKQNESSVVLKISFQNKTFILAGDIEEKGIEEILRSFGRGDLSCDLIKIPHHGAYFKDGYFEKLIDATNPKFAVISCGPNSYGHPSKSVLNHLHSKKIAVYSTDKCGPSESVLAFISNSSLQLSIASLSS